MVGKLGALALGVILLLCILWGDPGADPFIPLVDTTSCLMGTGAMFICCGSADMGVILPSASLFTAAILGVNESYVIKYTGDRQARSSLSLKSNCRI